MLIFTWNRYINLHELIIRQVLCLAPSDLLELYSSIKQPERETESSQIKYQNSILAWTRWKLNIFRRFPIGNIFGKDIMHSCFDAKHPEKVHKSNTKMVKFIWKEYHEHIWILFFLWSKIKTYLDIKHICSCRSVSRDLKLLEAGENREIWISKENMSQQVQKRNFAKTWQRISSSVWKQCMWCASFREHEV